MSITLQRSNIVYIMYNDVICERTLLYESINDHPRYNWECQSFVWQWKPEILFKCYNCRGLELLWLLSICMRERWCQFLCISQILMRKRNIEQKYDCPLGGSHCCYTSFRHVNLIGTVSLSLYIPPLLALKKIIEFCLIKIQLSHFLSSRLKHIKDEEIGKLLQLQRSTSLKYLQRISSEEVN